jgi:hypothetical protein
VRSGGGHEIKWPGGVLDGSCRFRIIFLPSSELFRSFRYFATPTNENA